MHETHKALIEARREADNASLHMRRAKNRLDTLRSELEAATAAHIRAVRESSKANQIAGEAFENWMAYETLRGGETCHFADDGFGDCSWVQGGGFRAGVPVCNHHLNNESNRRCGACGKEIGLPHPCMTAD